MLRIETDARGLASGVTYVDAQGEQHFQPADVVVVSAFTLENNRLLLLSRSAKHPNGIGNDRGRVGKNYTYQIYPAPVTGLWEGKKLNMYMGNTTTIKIIYDYNADKFDHKDLDFIGGSQLYSEPCEREPVNSVSQLTTASGKSWGAEWKEEIRRNWDSYASIVTEGESIPYVDQFLDLDPNYRDRFGNPLLRISFDWHDNQRNMWRFIAQRAHEIMRAMNPTRIVKFTPELAPYNIHEYQSTHPTGGCIMGTDPSHSVTNTLRAGVGHAERLRDRRGPLPAEPRREPDRHDRRRHLPRGRCDARPVLQAPGRAPLDERERPHRTGGGEPGGARVVRRARRAARLDGRAARRLRRPGGGLRDRQHDDEPLGERELRDRSDHGRAAARRTRRTGRSARHHACAARRRDPRSARPCRVHGALRDDRLVAVHAGDRALRHPRLRSRVVPHLSSRARATIALLAVLAVVAAVSYTGRSASARIPAMPGADAGRGARLISSFGCGSCHLIDGIAGADAHVGPPLTNLARRRVIAGKLPNTPEDLARWIAHPQQIDRGDVMPDLGLSDQQASDIALYLYEHP